MAVELEIPDGDPWWLSPNLWTVPGPDPEGPPGTPVAGKACYLWARVTNKGRTAVNNATLRFYWANPAVGFNRTTANLVGTSFVNLGEGVTADVLCLTPWVPEYVNEGHECILGEAFHASLDPLPMAPEFNVPTDRHVAQRNISVVREFQGMFKLAFEVHNPERKERKFNVIARQDNLSRIKALIRHLGPEFKLPSGQGKAFNLGFATTPCPNKEEVKDAKELIKGLKVKPNLRAGFTLVGAVKGGPSLIHIEQRVEDQIIGGLSVLVVPERIEKKIKKRGGKES